MSLSVRCQKNQEGRAKARPYIAWAGKHREAPELSGVAVSKN